MVDYTLTSGKDTFVAPASGSTVYGTAATLNPGDSLTGGAGTDVLVLVGSGYFHVDQLATFTGFENIRLVNATNTFASLALGSQPIEVDATGYLQIYVNSPSNWNSSDIINGDPSRATYLYFNNISQTYPPPPITYDLTANTFSFVTIDAGADSVSLLINNLDTAGVQSFNAFGSNDRLVTAGSALDLSHTTISGFAVVSTNGLGTTFTVADLGTAFQIAGGPGHDTIETSAFTFTADQRNAIFATASIETIIDTTGTYYKTAPSVTPTVSLSIDNTDVNVANGTGTVTFAFSEAPTTFALTDASAVGGTLSNLEQTDATHFTATFIGAANTDISNASVSVTAGSWQANGNPGAGATSTTFVVDTVTPTVAVSINNSIVNLANPTATVTFTFSEAPVAFTLTDTSAVGGTLSSLQQVNATTYTAIFTASPNTDISNATVSVTAGSWQEGNGNPGTAAQVETLSFSTLADPLGDALTEARGINNAGQIVGWYLDSGSNRHGFLYSGGTWTALNDPSANSGTSAFGINDEGQIVGSYNTLTNVDYFQTFAFQYAGGSYTLLFQGVPNGINNGGQIVGSSFSGTPMGFIYSGGTLKPLSIPVPNNPHTAYSAYAYGINNAGQIVGYYQDNQNVHGFLYNGTYAPLDDPLGTNGTYAYGINDLGQIVGAYFDSNNKEHGFLYSDGIYTTIDDPLGSGGTVAYGINNQGQIVGDYFDSNGEHAFIATLPPPTSFTVDTVITTVIEAFGSTSLVEVGSNFFFYPAGTFSGPELRVYGAPFVAGQFGAWTPIGVEQTASGYEVAWKVTGADQYTVWNTDSSGNYVSDIGTVSGSSVALESLEPSFQQDLNGDRVIGVPPTTTIIEAFGSTSLVEVGSNFLFYPVGGSSGPELRVYGTPFVAGQFGAWTPIGVEQTASGYEVAWKVTGADQYTVWNTDSNGNYISDIGVVSGSSVALGSVEPSFQQDLNGDRVIGVPPTTNVIEAFGSTSLVEIGSNFFFYPVGGSSGPELRVYGTPFAAGQFGAWTPIGVEQTASGYEVAWKVTGADQYTVWNTDSNGNYISDIGVVSGSSVALGSVEPSFQQDLNGDGMIGEQYVWIGPIAGSWDVAGNWENTTAGLDPATVAPGSNDRVTINAAAGSAVQVITGTGASAFLTINGPTSLAGNFTTGALADNGLLTVNTGNELTVAGNATINSTLFIDGTLTTGSLSTLGAASGLNITGGTLTTGSLTTSLGVPLFSLGSGATLSVTGNVTGTPYLFLTDSTFTVGGTFTSGNAYISSHGGSRVQLAALAGANSMLLDVDGTSSVEVGTAGGAAVGSITIDNGVTATVFGSSFQAPSIVDNGTIIVAAGGGVSLHGSLSGNGQIEIASDAELDVYGPAALNAPSISFEGSGDALTLTRSAFNGSQQFTSTLIGFDADDVINYTGTVTSAVYASTGTNIGTLSLYNNTTLVGTLTLAGDYSGDAFSAVSTSSGTQIVDPPAPMVDVPNAATSEISSASVDAVTFTGNTGTLQLDQSQSFAGTVAGFGAENQIDLADISFWANTTLGYSPNAANNAGILSVSDGTHVANIALLGQYMASSFVMASDGHGGTLINDPPANQQPLLTHPHA